MVHTSSGFIHRLNELQIKNSTNRYYQEGLWPSQRSNSLFRFNVEDNNIFISASIAYILSLVYNSCAKHDQLVIKQMLDRFYTRTEDYRNKDGKISYNFWRTSPTQHFPNGLICQHLDYFRLPDDADDTSLIFLCHQKKQSEVEQFKQLLAEHANTVKKQIKKIDKRFHALPAYTTFFAVKMPNEFDICVQTNILAVLYKYNLDHDEFTTATMDCIKQCIKLDLIRRSPFQVAPNYARESIIYYHILRLIHFSKTEDFTDVTDLLIDQVRSLAATDQFDRLLIGLCKKMIGDKYVLPEYEASDFSPFFIAGMFSAFDNKLAQMVAPWHFTHIRYHSEALNTAFLLQYHSF